MSFWKIAGEFAKDFAKGYVNERGVEGTLEDLGDLAKGAKSFFGSGDSDDDDSANACDKFFDTYNSLMDNEEYESASDFVAARYYSVFQEHDAIYYFLLAKAQYFAAEADDEDTLRKALSNINKARTDDAEIKKEIKDLRKYIEESLHRAIALNHWDEMKSRLADLKQNREFDKALTILEEHYNSYEDGQRDYYYWEEVFLIYECMMAVNNNTSIINKLKHCIDEARKAAESEEAKEQLRHLEENLHGDIVISHFFETRDKIKELFGQSKYDEAERLLKAHYREYEGNTFDFAYWSLMFDLILFSAADEVRPLDISGAEECILNARHMADNDAEKLERVHRMESELNEAKEVCRNKPKSAEPSKSADSISDSENEYLEEVKACFADDNEITARERRLLDKLRVSLGIPEERAAELEAMAQPQALTDDEKEYAEEIKACLADDGEITDRERRLLDRLRNSLGISEQRAEEIEKSLK